MNDEPSADYFGPCLAGDPLLVRDREAVAKNLWDFGPTRRAFRGRGYPSDIDGIYEYRGYFLVWETKHAEAPTMRQGQFLMLQALSRLSNFTVIEVHGNPMLGTVTAFRVFGDSRGLKPCTMSEYLAFVEGWYAGVCAK